MNPKYTLTAATMAALAGVSQAVFDGGFTTITGLGIGTGAVTVSTAGAALALGGLAILKVAALAAVASRRGRGKRDVDSDDAVFGVVAQIEPAACYRRLICELATGKLENAESNQAILSLFNGEVPVQDAKFEYAVAAKVGKVVKDIQACEIRYSCPISGKDMNDALTN